MTQAKRQQVSAPSQLLSNEENAMVVKILGPRCPSLATTVVQIYMSDSASGNLYMILYTAIPRLTWFCDKKRSHVSQKSCYASLIQNFL